MWALIGILRPIYYDLNGKEEIVKLFYSKKQAEKYLKRSRLKRPVWNKKYEYYRIFKHKSLLSRFGYAYIEKEDEEPIIDPPVDSYEDINN